VEKEEMRMKKLLVVLMLGMFLAGCGTAAEQSEFWKHPSMFTSWDHMKYSWGGYEDCGPGQTQKSKQQKWWGEQYNECAPKK
jgi:hypothetical protein